MTSLRARLVAAVLIIAAVGLVALAAIVYFEQRSFLLDRAAEQARDGAGDQHPGGRQREQPGQQARAQGHHHVRGLRSA